MELLRRSRLLSAAVLVPLALTGCGGDDPAPRSDAVETTAPGSGSIVVAALGDSITAGSPLWDPDEGVRESLRPVLDERSQYEYWAAAEDPSLEFRNCGVFGERTDEIAQRLDACADGANVLIIQP